MQSTPEQGQVPANPLKEPAIERFTLSNGLQVFMVVDHSAPLVAVDVNYHVGSRNEKPGSTGFAHLFEHMMFQGSRDYNDDYFKPLQDIGGEVNGATSTDRTRYWEIVPSPYLERALWLESDRMGYLLDAMTQERLDNQKSVVQNERRQNYDNRPYGTVWEKMAAIIYPKSHPYSWLTIGSMEDIGAATLDDVKAFFRTWYTPNNATIAIVGDIDIEQAKALVTRYFGSIPPGPAVSSVARWDVSLDSDVTLDVTDRVQLPRSYVTWTTVPSYDREEAALDLFGLIYGGGKTSRLYQELVYKRQIAQDAVAGQRSSQIAGVFDLMLTPRPGVDPVRLEVAAIEVLEQMLSGGITAQELDSAKVQVTSQFVRGMENIGGFGGLADRINEYQHMIGRPDGFRQDLQRYLDVTAADVVAAGTKYLRAHKVVARVRPIGDVAVSGQPDADRSALPGRGADRAFDLPDRASFELSNGLQVVVVPQGRVPLVSMALVVPGGASADPLGRFGLASLTGELLSEGAGSRDAVAFAEAVEATGGQLQVDTDADSWFVYSSVLKANLSDMLDLLHNMVASPQLSPDELERQRADRLTSIAQALDSPMYNASVAAVRAVFGGHPYGHPRMGTTADVGAITIDDVRSLYKNWFIPSNAVLIVVGDVSRDEMEKMLTDSLGQWKSTSTVAERQIPPVPAATRSVTVVNMPGASQSVILVAVPGPSRSAPGFAAVDVLNTALGGSFVSRLNLNLREDKGYTYGARTIIDMKFAAGIAYAAAPVQTEVTGAALAEMLNELTGIGATNPISDTELKYAQNSIVNGYAGRFATIDKIVSELVDTYVHSLPVDSVETFPAEVGAVSIDDVTAAAARYFQPSVMTIVVAGDAAKVVPQLESLNLGVPVNVTIPGTTAPSASEIRSIL